MSSISRTIERLSALGNGMSANMGIAAVDHLDDLSNFGSNPGSLRARTFVPDDLALDAALVVVLHGCTQTAAAYDHGSGWSRLAEKHGFALLFPEQQRANNPNLCFNWFAPADARRDQGEALSIRQMIDAMVDRNHIDRTRIFITGLSAGGAMTAVMLATYSELFAGGAVIAGLPYGTAWSVQEALMRMRGRGLPSAAELAATVRGATAQKGSWPTLSIWHGDADATVSPANADALVEQWCALHGVGSMPSAVDSNDSYRRRTWRDETGREVIEDYRIAGMGHGTPLDTSGAEGCGASGPHMLDVGVSSTRLIAARWGLITTPLAAGTGTGPAVVPHSAATLGERWKPSSIMPVELPAGVERTINDALRAAGLMR